MEEIKAERKKEDFVEWYIKQMGSTADKLPKDLHIGKFLKFLRWGFFGGMLFSFLILKVQSMGWIAVLGTMIILLVLVIGMSILLYFTGIFKIKKEEGIVPKVDGNSFKNIKSN